MNLMRNEDPESCCSNKVRSDPLHPHTELLVDFFLGRLQKAFVGMKFSPRKLPKAPMSLFAMALGNQDQATARDNSRENVIIDRHHVEKWREMPDDHLQAVPRPRRKLAVSAVALTLAISAGGPAFSIS